MGHSWGGLLGRSVIALPDGKIAVVSFGFDLNTQQTKGLVMRLNSDGSFDETFNKTGKASVELGDTGDNAARGVEAHTDGGLVVYGNFNEGGTLGIYVVRFKEDGTRDEQFSTVMLSAEKRLSFYDIAVRKKDGIIALAGGQRGEGDFDGVGVIVVLKGDGSYHPVFNNGKPLFQKVLPETGQQWSTCAFGGKDENTLIMSGTSGGTWLLDDTRAVLARYLLTGYLDTSFNGQGWVVFDQPDRLEVARDLIITTQDRIVVCGEFRNDRQAIEPQGGWIARYLA
ncbi:delta-60 repeat domain-containing protein [Pseudomonas sp. NIBR-H-19]|uniref:delta-60 repeat domain-containing protein n=1 Tax=Pseudomonas sp. NIBR-H-19 TaxID=2901380 RepID=UPI002FCAB83F